MLFNSDVFIFVFLPIVLAGFSASHRLFGHRGATIWLVAASLFFYGWWNPLYLWILLFSLAFNFLIGERVARNSLTRRGKMSLTLGVIVNLGLLGYFKYATFVVENVLHLGGLEFGIRAVVLPIGISFFTFQQIAYLVDAYRAEAKEYDFFEYALFVTFFPQLIAGPIVHHKEMMPQFGSSDAGRISRLDISVGLSIFIIGLFKKVVLADTAALYATPVFSLADSGEPVALLSAWQGAVAYTVQIYFDFSGYSDMAIGLGRLFGIRLPVNFNSPYKSENVIEFWRRWHITLSRFLRDYLYFPLGGHRRGQVRRYVNLMIVMLLGGLWHGAGWTFVFWGGLHGVYLMLNQLWRKLGDQRTATPLGMFSGRMLTVLCVIFAWVFFRAETFGGAIILIRGMPVSKGFGAGRSHWLVRRFA